MHKPCDVALRLGKLPPGTKTVWVFPYDSAIRFLPAYYFLPPEIISASAVCRDLPRCPAELGDSPHWAEVIHSMDFFQLVMEGIAYLAWPHIGVSAPKESFSMDDPLYRWIYATVLHTEHLAVFGYSQGTLFRMKRGEYYRYRTMDEAHLIMGVVMKRVIHEQNMAPIIDCVKKIRCDEDFGARKSWAKIDFLRKKYKTRDLSKIREVSLEQERETQQSECNRAGTDIPDPSVHIEDDVLGDAVVAEFKKTLSPRDMQVLERRMRSETYQQIAAQMGYQNHKKKTLRLLA